MRTVWPARGLWRAGAWVSFAALLLMSQLAAIGSTLIADETDPTPTSDPEPPSPSPESTTTGTPAPNVTATASLTPSPTPEEQPATATPTDQAPTPGATHTEAATATSTATPTPTPTPTATDPTAVPPQSVLINEVAWSGTLASANDEWIELHNPGPDPVPLAGWRLTDGDDLNASLVGTIPAYGFYLLERTDDTTVADLLADKIYTGSMRNSGERLELLGPAGEIVDTANAGGGSWPAGVAESRASMERRGGIDLPGDWATFSGYFGNGVDASGNPIPGTPGQANSLFYPTPTPTGIPSQVVINEVLIRPRHDWEGTGGVTTADEFIELYNPGRMEVYLKGWWLDDGAGTGSAPFDLPGVTIPPKGFVVFFRTQTRIALNDTGDTVRLLAPDGHTIDRISYLSIRAANLSFGRLPDGSDHLRYGLWPTPRQPNLPFEEPGPTAYSGPFFPYVCSGAGWPAGDRTTRASMERVGIGDTPSSWASFPGPPGEALDAEGGEVWGTPGQPNSVALTGAEPGAPPVLINEVAWAGTDASASDEWIELHNPGTEMVNLAGWVLISGGGLNISLLGSVPPDGYFLAERSDDSTISNLAADLVYTGSLHDGGTTLWLIAPNGIPVDSANAVRPGWPVFPIDRAAHLPAQVAWLHELGLVGCRSP